MSEDPILVVVEKQEWLTPVQEAGEAFVKKTYEAAGEPGQAVKNALHGVWLGHPLHAAITDVPVGSWTAAAVLDFLEARGEKQYGAGADAAVAVGLAGALASAVSGLTDWSDTQGKPQRVGALHALLNVAATLLYSGSYVLRKRGNRGVGRGFSFLGYGVVLASAYLGGALTYAHRIGVDHSADPDNDLPAEYTPVCAESELHSEELKKVTAKGTDILLFRRGDQIFALGEKCSHLGGPLSEGQIEGDTVQCPWHGSRFCITDGSVVDGPATHRQPTLDVLVKDAQVFVKTRAVRC
ncbi:MAG: Rieske 2Fe-2S domain-containing protein [Bryobacteraceae bacterium]